MEARLSAIRSVKGAVEFPDALAALTPSFLSVVPNAGMPDENGRYTIRHVPAGVYTLRFDMIGYARYEVRGVRVVMDLKTTVDAELEPEVIDDLVASLDCSDAAATAGFIEERLGQRAVEPLLRAAGSRRYWLRWNSIKLLDRLGRRDDIDMGRAYLLDLQYAGSCSTRKRAARRLGEMKYRPALEALRRARKRGLLENLCMGDTLDEAIQAIKK